MFIFAITRLESSKFFKKKNQIIYYSLLDIHQYIPLCGDLFE